MKTKTVQQNILVSKIKDIFKYVKRGLSLMLGLSSTSNKEEFESCSMKNSVSNKENSGYDEVDRPKHYCNTSIQPIDVIDDWSKVLPSDEVFSFGNAIKYIKRYRDKGTPIKDIDKAIWYLQHLKGILEQKGEK